jgi:integrase/recombinase XerD
MIRSHGRAKSIPVHFSVANGLCGSMRGGAVPAISGPCRWAVVSLSVSRTIQVTGAVVISDPRSRPCRFSSDNATARSLARPSIQLWRRNRRVRPHIYSDVQIAEIVKASAKLPSIYGMRGLTCSTSFGLIAATGLRISEALNLDNDDVDLNAGVLRVRRGKHGRERFIPLAASVTAKLKSYAAERDRLLRLTPKPFFVNREGRRFSDCSARYNFALACQSIGLRAAQQYGRHGRGPRIHDLHHSFAAQTMIDWYRTGKDAAREMIKLTTYLGHTNPENTYWYIEAVPELLELASDRVADADEGKVRQ